ncbi:hypothetical protein P7C70_g347, partial [Phenoliferia sp. Uapishka_3]
MARVFHAYVGLLQRHTLATQMVTGGVTSGLGDVIYQQGIEKRGWSNHETPNVFASQIRLIPVYARPPFLNLFAIGWSTFLASANKAGGIAPISHKLEEELEIALEVME